MVLRGDRGGFLKRKDGMEKVGYSPVTTVVRKIISKTNYSTPSRPLINERSRVISFWASPEAPLLCSFLLFHCFSSLFLNNRE